MTETTEADFAADDPAAMPAAGDDADLLAAAQEVAEIAALLSIGKLTADERLLIGAVRDLRELYKVHPERFAEDLAAIVAIAGDGPFADAFAAVVEMKPDALDAAPRKRR